MDTADFPTRIQKTTISATDNSFTDFSRQGNIVIFPICNGLSDHDTQLITIYDVGLYDQIYNTINIRRINENSLNEFKYILNFELWEDIFAEKEVNIIFNSSVNTFLRNFHSNFL